MKIQQKKLEIAIYLKEIWHDPIKETPKKDGALCIVNDGVDEEGNDTYDLFPWDEKMKAFDTGVGHYIDEDLKVKHAWICPEGCTRWCYLEDLLPEPKEIGECTKANPEKLEKRFWLRMELYKMYYAWHHDEMEEAFQWIYDAPTKDWRNMLECLRQADFIKDDNLKGTLTERGKQLFDFLS